MGMLNPELAVCRRLKLDYDSRRDSQTSLPTAPAADAAPELLVGFGSPAGPRICPNCGRPRAACYVRISTHGQEDGTSLQSQEESCRGQAEAKGYCVEERHIFRETYTAAELERPELDRLMAVAQTSVVAAVFVHHLDRWSRDPLHALVLMDELRKHGVELVFVQGNLEDTPEGRLILYVQGFAGQQERLRFIERTRTGKAAVARSGRLPNGTGAGLYGYDYDRANKIRVINDAESTVVRLIFRWASEGVSRYQIAVRLNNLNIPTKRNCRWHPLGIQRILENPAYTGVQFYGENRYRKVKGSKREVTPNPASEVIPIKGYTPELISKELFELVRERLASRQAAATRSDKQYVLTGFVKCHWCGSPVVGSCLSGKYRYYRCRATTPTSLQPATCKARYIPADELEEYVHCRVSGVVMDPSVLASELEDHILRQIGDTADAIPSLKREIRDLEDEQGRLLQLRGKGNIDQDILERQIGPVKALCDAKRELLSALEEQQRMRDSAAEIRDRIADYCRQLEPKLANLDFDGKRALLGVFGVRVEAIREDVTITVVVDPKLDNFTTIARTLASRHEHNHRCRWA